MKTALVISSCVAASRVGATASAFCLRRLGVETVVLPTTLFGRHPGWGAPGGRVTEPDLLRSIWDGVAAQDVAFDGVMTGYMGDTDHVALAAEIITGLKAKNPALHVLVDPVMGDHGKLYIKDSVAQAIKTQLLPLATVTTPNAWELSYLTGQSTDSLSSVIAATRTLPCATVVTSVEQGDSIGTLWAGEAPALMTHPKFARVPNGGGDSVAGTFLAHRLNGLPPREALARATASIFAIISAAQNQDSPSYGLGGELPIVEMQDALITAPPLAIRDLP